MRVGLLGRATPPGSPPARPVEESPAVETAASQVDGAARRGWNNERMASPAIVHEPLSDAELQLIDAYWRAANYLSVGQIYLLDNPLLARTARA